jgi:hypothetical protein
MRVKFDPNQPIERTMCDKITLEIIPLGTAMYFDSAIHVLAIAFVQVT